MTCFGRKFIYSVSHANDLIHKGYKCLGTGYNENSHKYYWVFDWDEIQLYYETENRYKKIDCKRRLY